MDQPEISFEQQLAIALSCHLWLVSQDLGKASSIPGPMATALENIRPRLETLSLSILRHTTGPSFYVWRHKHMAGGTFLRRISCIYSTCKLFPALLSAVNQYDSGGTRRKKISGILIAKFLDALRELELNPYDEHVREILSEAMLECETMWMYAMAAIETRKSPELGPPIQQSSLLPKTRYVFRFLRPNGEPKEVAFCAYRIVLVKTWHAYIDTDGHELEKVPDLTQLRLRDPENYEMPQIELGSYNLNDLHELSLIALHLAKIKHMVSAVPRTIERSPGVCLLHDKLRISINGGRPKIRDVELYEHSLRISRQKGAEQIVLYSIETSSLLSVTFRLWDQSKGTAMLAVFWKINGERLVIDGAQIFYEDLDVLWIWAAFLTANFSAGNNKGQLHVPGIPSDFSMEDSDTSNVMDLETRHLVELVPLIARGELGPDNSDSLSSHLVSLGRHNGRVQR